jgi:hypothetical protein
MNKKISLSVALTLIVVTPLTLLSAERAENSNRLSIGPQFTFNYKANFQSTASNFNPGPATGGANHTYDDGYVLVDASGNFGGLTTNWGYINPTQVVGAGLANGMEFRSIQPSGSSSVEDDPQYGFEIIYQRVLSALSETSPGIWGFQVGFSYTDLDLDGNDRGTTPVTIDTYPLNGVLPPPAPYNGTFVGPGTLLGDTPVRTLGSAALIRDQKLSGHLFNFRLGPFAEWEVTPKLSVSASAGLTLAPTKLEYDYSETVTLSSGPSFASSGHASTTKLLYGGYVDARLRYDFNESWGAYVGAQFQSLNSLQQSAGGRSAKFDPGATIALSAGITWQF